MPVLSSPLAPLLRKLEGVTALTPEEQTALLGLPGIIRGLKPRQDLINLGHQPSHCWLVVEGWVHRYTLLSEGRRQILSFHMVGDFADLPSLYLPDLDFTVGTITPVTVVGIPHEALRRLADTCPKIGLWLWKDALTDAAMARKWIASIGRRSAYQRLAHLFCEFYARLSAVGLVQDDRYRLPITQVDLADATGMTSVHVNRTLKELRAAKLIALRGQELTILDWERLVKVAEFDSGYLQVQKVATPKPQIDESGASAGAYA